MLFIIFPVLLVFLNTVRGQANTTQPEPQQLVCHPFGECQPCPEDSLSEPFCYPFGNRQLVHCLPPNSENPHALAALPYLMKGEIPAWQSCGRIVSQERADYWEFMVANVAFAAVALLVLYKRSRSLIAQQERTLAARIGVRRPW